MIKYLWNSSHLETVMRKGDLKPHMKVLNTRSGATGLVLGERGKLLPSHREYVRVRVYYTEGSRPDSWRLKCWWIPNLTRV